MSEPSKLPWKRPSEVQLEEHKNYFGAWPLSDYYGGGTQMKFLTAYLEEYGWRLWDMETVTEYKLEEIHWIIPIDELEPPKLEPNPQS